MFCLRSWEKEPRGSGPGAEPRRLSWLVGRGASILGVEAVCMGGRKGLRVGGNCRLASVCGAQQASGRSCGVRTGRVSVMGEGSHGRACGGESAVTGCACENKPGCVWENGLQQGK